MAKLLLARRRDLPQASRGVRAKLEEAVVALRLEHRLSKREILALYLNLASYGNQLVGAERASRAYFGCGVELLTPAQAAFLASLPQRPTAFNPYRNAQSARARQLYVLDRLQALGWMPPDAIREAREERLAVKREPSVFFAPHFVERVLARGAPASAGPPSRLRASASQGAARIVTTSVARSAVGSGPTSVVGVEPRDRALAPLVAVLALAPLALLLGAGISAKWLRRVTFLVRGSYGRGATT